MFLNSSQDVPNLIEPIIFPGIEMTSIVPALCFIVVVRREVYSPTSPAILVLADAVGLQETCFIPS
jgi:hypothetical protein